MNLSTKIRIFIILLIIVFTSLSACIVPRVSDYFVTLASEAGIEISAVAVSAVGVLICLPCLAVLVIAYGFGRAVERDEVFTDETARRITLISVILFADATVFLGVTIAVFCLGESLISPIFALVDLIAFGLAVLLYILADYIRRAALIKEEADGTL